MNILHIGTSDISGGAAKASWRLHKALLSKGHDSKMLVGIKKSESHDVNQFPSNQGFSYRMVNSISWRLGLQYLIYPWAREFFDHPWYKKADIINLHNIRGGFFSHTLLPKIKQPIVWTLHDPWPMTGHCGYPEMNKYLQKHRYQWDSKIKKSRTFADLLGCEKWKTGCGRCPNLKDYPEIGLDTTRFLWKKKKEIYRTSRITFIGPSQWMVDHAFQSPLTQRHPIRKIPYGINTENFYPCEKQAVRKALSWPMEKKIILFVSADVNNERKGLKHIKESPEFKFITVGKNGMYETDDQRKMQDFYCAADVLAFPSLADNLPLTVMESLACGTPVVAFNVGGLSDLVVDGKTGFLASVGSTEDFNQKLRWILSFDKARSLEMSKACREHIVEKFSLELQAEQYEKIYEHLLE